MLLTTNGLCKLVAKDSVASGNWLVIDCKDGSSTPGTQLQLYGNWGPNDSNGNAQLFNIYTVENYQQPPKPPKVELTVPGRGHCGRGIYHSAGRQARFRANMISENMRCISAKAVPDLRPYTRLTQV